VHAETLDVLLAATSKPDVVHHGERFSFDLTITPAFLQSSPAIWTAATSEASARRAGERGLKVCFGFSSAEEIGQLAAAHAEGARATGMPSGSDRLDVRRQIELVEDESHVEDAAQLVRDGAAELMRFSMEAMKVPDAPPKAFHPDELLFGTPEQVADEIIRQCQVAGTAHFLASFNIFDRDRLRANHDLFATEVIPRLRAAEIG
jgi:alkanesulfonate monooxygenase SsuD/methylene tetrahydromethanopterin reductase-like flavin-dependent oxidoreductase (luciferase family)